MQSIAPARDIYRQYRVLENIVIRIGGSQMKLPSLRRRIGSAIVVDEDDSAMEFENEVSFGRGLHGAFHAMEEDDIPVFGANVRTLMEKIEGMEGRIATDLSTIRRRKARLRRHQRHQAENTVEDA